jgi:creatinine amidohydrolase
VTDDTGSGDPALASPVKGEKFLDAVTSRIASYLVDLDAADLNALYE